MEGFSPTINFGDKDSPARPKGPTKDRGPLQQMGEGGLVTLRGYVFKARQEGAESVNCAKNVPNQPAYHDIHISIVSSHDETSECSSVVAFRYGRFTPSMRLKFVQGIVTEQDNGNPLQTG